jgi:beclin 1
VRRERDAYIAFDDELRSGEEEKVSREEVTKEIEKLVVQASDTKAELEAAKLEEEGVEAELRALDEEEKKLEEEERQFWQSYTALSRDASELSAQRSSLQASLLSERAQLNRLQATNVYNDAFSIGYEDGYGTINGLRLGRLQNDATSRGGAVEWTEINAAWGQTALLLVTLARKVDLTFTNYKIVPMGSFSAVEKVGGDRKEVYVLHGSSDWQLGRLLPDRRFDHGMIAFLDCLRQLCEHVAARDSTFKSPHIINKDKIGGSSIRKSDEIWTRALRNVLVTLNLLLSWTIKMLEDA